MAKSVISKEKARVLAGLIKEKPHGTPLDYAERTNSELRKSGQSPTMEVTHVHAFLNNDPAGEECRGLVSLSMNARRIPNWANQDTPRVEDSERRPGELVVFQEKTGDRTLDDSLTKGMQVVTGIAHYIPASKQENIVALAAVLNYAGHYVRTREQVYESQDRERKTQDKYIKLLEQRLSETQTRLPPAAE